MSKRIRRRDIRPGRAADEPHPVGGEASRCCSAISGILAEKAVASYMPNIAQEPFGPWAQFIRCKGRL